MRSLWDAVWLEETQSRLSCLTPETPPRWGTFTAPAVVCHLADQLRVAVGEVAATRMRSPLRYQPVKWLALSVLPIPRGLRAPPEFLSTAPTEWDADRARLDELLARCVGRGADEPWAMAPALGALSKQQWGIFSYKHFAYHLGQFGV